MTLLLMRACVCLCSIILYCVCVYMYSTYSTHSLSLCVCVCGDIICMTSHAESNVYMCVHVVNCWWAKCMCNL